MQVHYDVDMQLRHFPPSHKSFHFFVFLLTLNTPYLTYKINAMMEVKKATILVASIKRRKKKTNEERGKKLCLCQMRVALSQRLSLVLSPSPLTLFFSKSQTIAFFYIQIFYSSCTYCGVLFS